MDLGVPEIRVFDISQGEHAYQVAHASLAKSSSGKNDDAISIKQSPEGFAILVADGASGFGHGHLASGALAEVFDSDYVINRHAGGPVQFLTSAERFVSSECARVHAEGADTTGIVLTVIGDWVEGASVGDSEAHIVGYSDRELTAGQRRRPRLGNRSLAVSFSGFLPLGDTMIAATDGLWNRLDIGQVGRILVRAAGPDQAVAHLLALAKTSSGKYDDDISIVCVVRTR